MFAVRVPGEPTRLALADESADGNLALAAAVAVRDAGLAPPHHAPAVYPFGPTGTVDTRCCVDSATAKPLIKAMVSWFVDKLLAKPDDKSDPRLDLVHAKLAGLPPQTIINARTDPLREDGALPAAALKQAGVKVQRWL